jgi:hypothetical protein
MPLTADTSSCKTAPNAVNFVDSNGAKKVFVVWSADLDGDLYRFLVCFNLLVPLWSFFGFLYRYYLFLVLVFSFWVPFLYRYKCSYNEKLNKNKSIGL